MSRIELIRKMFYQCIDNVEKERRTCHAVAECKMLAQEHYRLWCHDRVAGVIHWVMCQRFGFPHGNKWYNHIPESVLENDDV